MESRWSYGIRAKPNDGSKQVLHPKFSSVVSLACLCASKEMYPVKTERPMYTSACDASVGLPMRCILEVGEKEGESPLTLSGGSTPTGC